MSHLDAVRGEIREYKKIIRETEYLILLTVLDSSPGAFASDSNMLSILYDLDVKHHNATESMQKLQAIFYKEFEREGKEAVKIEKNKNK